MVNEASKGCPGTRSRGMTPPRGSDGQGGDGIICAHLEVVKAIESQCGQASVCRPNHRGTACVGVLASTTLTATPAHVETGRRCSRLRGRGITQRSTVQTFSSRVVGNGGGGFGCEPAGLAALLPKRVSVAGRRGPTVTPDPDEFRGGIPFSAAG